ncbi:MAG: hypothetical protein JXR96_26665 [Deltaproteobacteria bacterium]|nr:hypothetical protein [Deltaproteobacteria bacterium]
MAEKKKKSPKTAPKKAPASKIADEKTTAQAEEQSEAAGEPEAQDADASGVDLVDMVSMAKQLRMPVLRLRKMVQSGQVPGVKVDGQWRFNPKLVYRAVHRRSMGR